MKPQSPSEFEELSPEAAAWVDGVCDRFEAAWKEALSGSAAPCLTTFLEGFQESERRVLVDELTALDQACRRRHAALQRTDKGRNSEGDPDAVPDTDTPPGAHTTVAPHVQSPSWPSLPGLELLRVLGSGGMGVVYHARQPKLDRDVAVKLLRETHLGGSGQRERFSREARAIARLQHPHLVQLYEFGDAPGHTGTASQPYLVLEYVSGGSLADRLCGSRLAANEAALLVETLADAIHYAHQQGIIHRDLKPANVLLAPKTEPIDPRQTPFPRTRPSQTGIAAAPEKPKVFRIADYSPKVTDFGLAKFLTGVDLTQSGDVLGTPCYMAPEQATGKAGAITEAADVYGLGAILYEVLSGRPPFIGETVAATVLQVEMTEPVPLRRTHNGIPRDLETICLKCLRKEPRRRYASAKDLADDLRRFRNGEPILARPVSSGERLLGWCRRKPLVASLLCALTLVVMTGLAVFAWQWQQSADNAAAIAQAQATIKAQQDAAKRERDQADRNLRLLKEHVDDLTTLSRDLWEHPQLRPTAIRLLKKTLALYDDLLPEEAADPRLRFEAVRMYGQIADTYHSLGQWAQSVDAFRLQADLLARLQKDHPEDRDIGLKLARCHRSRGNVLRDLGESAKARKAYDQAVDVLEARLKKVPDDSSDQAALANTLLNRATVMSRTVDAEALERLYVRVVELNRAAANAEPKNDWRQVDLALGLEDQGMFYLATGRRDKARSSVREALAIHQKLLAGGKLKGYVERYAARSYANNGRVLAAHGAVDDAEKSYQEALRIQSELGTAKSTYPFHRAELAQTLASYATLLEGADRMDEAEDLRRQVIGHYDSLKQNFPQDKPRHRLLVLSYLELARLLLQRGMPDKAAEPFRQAFAVDADDPDTNNELAWFLVMCPEPKLRDPARAVSLAQKAVDAKNWGNYWNTLGAAHFRNGDDKAALAALETSMSKRSGGNSFDWFFVAMAHQRLGDHAKARQWFDRAVTWMEKHRPDDPELVRFRAEAQAMMAAPGKS